MGGVGGHDGSSGEEESEFLTLLSHAGNLVVHARVDGAWGSGKSGTAQNSQYKDGLDLHF